MQRFSKTAFLTLENMIHISSHRVEFSFLLCTKTDGLHNKP